MYVGDCVYIELDGKLGQELQTGHIQDKFVERLSNIAIRKSLVIF